MDGIFSERVIFTGTLRVKMMLLQALSSGAWRAYTGMTGEEERTDDPFRGLRAGPVRASPGTFHLHQHIIPRDLLRS